MKMMKKLFEAKGGNVDEQIKKLEDKIELHMENIEPKPSIQL